ncbi:hypothetical protein ACOYR1_07945 [Thalassotalea piscium]
MRLTLLKIPTILLTTLLIASHAIADSNPVCDQTTNTQLVIHDVFNLNEKDTLFIHSWANFLHVKTKKRTLINEAAFFLKKCEINELDLDELERHLRSKKYIRNASVKSVDDSVTIETWDNWSLLPTLDLSRKGGKNKFAFGIKDRNLFGLGIDAEIEYFNSDQRTGYKFDTSIPLFLHQNIHADVTLSNNNDGTAKAFFLRKDLVSFDTQNAYTIGFSHFNQVDTQYENGVISEQFSHQQRYATLHWQWLDNNSVKDTLRFGVGFTSESHTFSPVDEERFMLPEGLSTDNLSVQHIPKDREFNYPFVSINYLQKDYIKLTNIHLINHIEDFNFGWNIKASIGTDLSNNGTAPRLIWEAAIAKGFKFSENSFLFVNAEFEGESYSKSNNSNRAVVTLTTEYFHKINPQWSTYFKNTNQFSRNQFLDDPIVLGGDTGIRGFPLQFQHSKHNSQFTFEARYYPHINIYKLLELGAAGFIDTGRAFSPTVKSETPRTWMTSIGVGARLYSTHSSESRVIHFDIIKPLSTNTHVNNIEFRITTKHSF